MANWVARSCTTNVKRSRTTSGGRGIRRSSTSSATSIRFGGGSLTTTRSRCCAKSLHRGLRLERSRSASSVASIGLFASSKSIWRTRHLGLHGRGCLGARPVAYFSAEFGIHESIPIYSGGLGVLSGDHIKAASGLGLPLVAIGLFYDQGYFRQRLDENGYQLEEYVDTKVEDLPLHRATNQDGSPLLITIETRQTPVHARVWQMDVGRTRLYLLDCNVEGNSPEDRSLTSRLYGGDERTRIRQELVLGVGGYRALRAMNIMPGVLHLNEGHSAFRAARSDAAADGTRWARIQRRGSRSRSTHRLHDPHAGSRRTRPVCARSRRRTSRSRPRWIGNFVGPVDGAGPRRTHQSNESFCMTVLGLKLSRRANAVSALHGHISRRMWATSGPGVPRKKSPLGTLPTVCTFPRGSPGRCNNCMTGTSPTIGSDAWAEPRCGAKFRTSTPANCGKRTKR